MLVMQAAKHKSRIRLKKRERLYLLELTSAGECSARVFKRARVLQLLDNGWRPTDAPAAAGVGEATARRVRARYEAEGLEAALFDRPRRGAERLLTVGEETKIVAMVCGAPPDGRARWTVRLTAQEAVARGIVAQVGRETVRVVLRDHELKPWREKNVVRQRNRPRVH